MHLMQMSGIEMYVRALNFKNRYTFNSKSPKYIVKRYKIAKGVVKWECPNYPYLFWITKDTSRDSNEGVLDHLITENSYWGMVS